MEKEAIELHNGGDEFIVLLIIRKSNKYAYRMSFNIEEHKEQYDFKLSHDSKIGISIGISTSIDGYKNISFDEMLNRADFALQRKARKISKVLHFIDPTKMETSSRFQISKSFSNSVIL